MFAVETIEPELLEQLPEFAARLRWFLNYRPDLAKLGTKVNLEFTVDHHYEQVAAHVARLPLYNPERKTA